MTHVAWSKDVGATTVRCQECSVGADARFAGILLFATVCGGGAALMCMMLFR